MSDSDLKQELDDALAGIRSLQNRVSELERQAGKAGNMADTALLSRSFMKRAFAVWGHNFVAALIISIPFWVVALVVIIISANLR